MEVWETITDQCKDLINKLLCAPEIRLTPSQALEHPWIKETITKTPSSTIPRILTKRLGAFQFLTRMEQSIMTYMSTQISEKEISELRKYFLALDKNGDGVLSLEEIQQYLKKRSSPEIIISIAQSLDTNSSGFIDYNGNFHSITN